jgi:peptide/nickel transport system permease protein
MAAVSSASGLGTRIGYVLLHRARQLVPTMLGVTLVTFFLVHLLPGGPVATLVGMRASPSAVAAVNRQLGLTQPVPVQYARYLWGLLHGNLGESILTGTPVSAVIGTHIWITLALLAYAVLLALALGIPLAVLAAARRDTWVDHLVRGTVVATLGLPTFWIGIMLIAFLSLRLHWFPSGGDGTGITGLATHLFLPALTLAFTFLSVLVRSLRAAVCDILRSDFIDAARLKGGGHLSLMYRHVLRISLLPVVTLTALNASYLLGASVVAENVFAVNGIGQQLVSAILQRDFIVVQGIALVFGLVVIVINVVADIVQVMLDPRTTP